ncbi:hypothetical protein MKX03_036813, partial [Papaver bracteatum]
LHYAIVWLGTPKLSFLVALDTGTNLLWVPCDCPSCLSVQRIVNKYSMTSSKTSKAVPCNSSLCELRSECSKSSGQCHYTSEYNPTINSSGILVEDILRLKTENHKPKEVNPRITFGCAQVQTGFYLDGTARSGLFGLGIGNTSVPSILSRKGLVADSFSMCFGLDNVGRISFGDKGSSDHEETPFNIVQQNPRYNITVTQLSVGGSLSDELDVTAIFYSGAEYTYLTDPAYTALCDSFDSHIDKRHSADPTINFEYCYDVNFYTHLCSTDIPNVTFIMMGGSQFNVYYPMVPISTKGTRTYCLCVIRSSGGNFIGNNFMTGHHIVFDREKMVMAWKASNCSVGIANPNDGIPQIPTVSPPTINVQPPSGNDGIFKNGLSSKTPQFSFGTPRNLYLINYKRFHRLREGKRETLYTTSTKNNKMRKTTLLSVGSSILVFAVIAWMLWRDGNKILELMEPCVEESSASASPEVLRCIQIGLLCVQQLPEDRTSMSSVVFMLGSEIVVLPEPKKPVFFVERSCNDTSTSSY